MVEFNEEPTVEFFKFVFMRLITIISQVRFTTFYIYKFTNAVKL